MHGMEWRSRDENNSHSLQFKEKRFKILYLFSFVFIICSIRLHAISSSHHHCRIHSHTPCPVRSSDPSIVRNNTHTHISFRSPDCAVCHTISAFFEDFILFMHLCIVLGCGHRPHAACEFILSLSPSLLSKKDDYENWGEPKQQKWLSVCDWNYISTAYTVRDTRVPFLRFVGWSLTQKYKSLNVCVVHTLTQCTLHRYLHIFSVFIIFFLFGIFSVPRTPHTHTTPPPSVIRWSFDPFVSHSAFVFDSDGVRVCERFRSHNNKKPAAFVVWHRKWRNMITSYYFFLCLAIFVCLVLRSSIIIIIFCSSIRWLAAIAIVLLPFSAFVPRQSNPLRSHTNYFKNYIDRRSTGWPHGHKNFILVVCLLLFCQFDMCDVVRALEKLCATRAVHVCLCKCVEYGCNIHFGFRLISIVSYFFVRSIVLILISQRNFLPLLKAKQIQFPVSRMISSNICYVVAIDDVYFIVA